VVVAFNKYALDGASRRMTKISNAPWKQASSLVSKWTCCVIEMYRLNLSEVNEEHIIEKAHDLHFVNMDKKFDIMHW